MISDHLGGSDCNSYRGEISIITGSSSLKDTGIAVENQLDDDILYLALVAVEESEVGYPQLSTPRHRLFR